MVESDAIDDLVREKIKSLDVECLWLRASGARAGAAARLPDGSRVNAIIPPLSLSGPLLTIRKFAQDRFALQELVADRNDRAERRRLPRACIKAELNILIAGGTGSARRRC